MFAPAHACKQCHFSSHLLLGGWRLKGRTRCLLLAPFSLLFLLMYLRFLFPLHRFDGVRALAADITGAPSCDVDDEASILIAKRAMEEGPFIEGETGRN